MAKIQTKNFIKLTVADWFTIFRILGSLSIIFLKPIGAAFYIVVLLCGASDVADGFIARSTKTTSSFGAKLDSVADVLFYYITILKIFPNLIKNLPIQIWLFVGIIFIIRMASYLIVAIKFHSFASLHTYLNKLTGFMIFFVPFIINFSWLIIYCWVVCSVAFISSINELLIHLTSKEEKTNNEI